jgi:SpoIVB peptidase S55
MKPPTVPVVSISLALALAGLFTGVPSLRATPTRASYWQVDDVRAGMRGQGKTVMKGTKIETFDAEVLGVLKNTSPGRDLVLCRLSGLNLDKTGVIAGMSGSPVYIDGKLLGAVSYAWPFGKEPIAGVTPFSQMQSYVEAYEHRDLVEQKRPTRVGLREPLHLEGRTFEAVTVAQGFDDPASVPEDALWMAPLRTPLAATGFTPHSLTLLRDRLHATGMVPMIGGAVTAKVAEYEKNVAIEAGAALTVALVTGDFDISGIGTVTHVEGKRVYGWGHPFFGVGNCDFPLMTGYVHTIYPRQSISFKMGSPLRTVGVINADVSTCIAGWLGREPDMLPLSMTVRRDPGQRSKSFHVKMVRQRAMLASLVFTALTNSVDMEGELPEELTARMKVAIDVEGRPPVVIEDTFSGNTFSAGRAPQALFSQIANLLNLLTYNNYCPVRINHIDCATQISSGRRTADIEAIELESETYAPGETLKATVFIRPYKGLPQRLQVTLHLPADLPEGSYSATVCDDLTNARRKLIDNPTLNNPQDLDQVFESLKVQADAKRTNLVVRVPLSAVGVAVDGKALPNLPPGMVQVLGEARRTGAQTMAGALVSRQSTDWVVQGSESVRFTVAKNKRLAARP